MAIATVQAAPINISETVSRKDAADTARQLSKAMTGKKAFDRSHGNVLALGVANPGKSAGHIPMRRNFVQDIAISPQYGSGPASKPKKQPFLPDLGIGGLASLDTRAAAPLTTYDPNRLYQEDHGTRRYYDWQQASPVLDLSPIMQRGHGKVISGDDWDYRNRHKYEFRNITSTGPGQAVVDGGREQALDGFCVSSRRMVRAPASGEDSDSPLMTALHGVVSMLGLIVDCLL